MSWYPGKIIRRVLRQESAVKSLSGKCHTLTLEDYQVLQDLDNFARLNPEDYASLLWLARGRQTRKDREEKYYVYSRMSNVRMHLLKEHVDRTRETLDSLWNKGMAEPSKLTIRMKKEEPEQMIPKTLKETYGEDEKWRITIAGTDCIHPPQLVQDCIEDEIRREERETGKITIMKAFKECWKKVECDV